jgi:hypothetical protein
MDSGTKGQMALCKTASRKGMFPHHTPKLTSRMKRGKQQSREVRIQIEAEDEVEVVQMAEREIIQLRLLRIGGDLLLRSHLDLVSRAEGMAGVEVKIGAGVEAGEEEGQRKIEDTQVDKRISQLRNRPRKQSEPQRFRRWCHSPILILGWSNTPRTEV